MWKKSTVLKFPSRIFDYSYIKHNSCISKKCVCGGGGGGGANPCPPFPMPMVYVCQSTKTSPPPPLVASYLEFSDWLSQSCEKNPHMCKISIQNLHQRCAQFFGQPTFIMCTSTPRHCPCICVYLSTKTLPLHMCVPVHQDTAPTYVCASPPSKTLPLHMCVPVHQDTAPTCVFQSGSTKTLPLHMCVPVHQDTAPTYVCFSPPRPCPYICVCQSTKTLPLHNYDVCARHCPYICVCYVGAVSGTHIICRGSVWHTHHM